MVLNFSTVNFNVTKRLFQPGAVYCADSLFHNSVESRFGLSLPLCASVLTQLCFETQRNFLLLIGSLIVGFDGVFCYVSFTVRVHLVLDVFH